MSGPPFPPPIPGFKQYRAYWQAKIQEYIDAGLAFPSGVQCPQDGEELLVFGKLKTGLAFDGDKPIMRTQFAICPNGHRHDL